MTKKRLTPEQIDGLVSPPLLIPTDVHAGATLEILLPWPPSTLSPNARPGHWAQLRRAQHRYRDACATATLLALRGRRVKDEPMRCRLVFRPPDARSYDRDNLVARAKAGLDGVAKALRINDRQFVEVSGRVGEPATARHLAALEVTLSADVPRESVNPEPPRKP